MAGIESGRGVDFELLDINRACRLFAHVGISMNGSSRPFTTAVAGERSGQEQMRTDKVCALSRRRFINTVSPLAVGCLGIPVIGKRLIAQDKPGFWSEYTLAERAVVDSSVMAQDITNFVGHGYGCAECALAVGLRYLGEPEERLGAAAVFSGGFGKGDLCGFFTGSMMAIGIAARKLHSDRSAMREFANPRRDEFWEWWQTRGPLHCSDLREMYDGSDQFLRMGQRAVAKLEELIAPAH